MSDSLYLNQDPEAVAKIKKLIESNETANILLALELMWHGGFPITLITHVYALLVFHEDFEVYYQASRLLKARIPEDRLHALKQKEEVLGTIEENKEAAASAFLAAIEAEPELDTPSLANLMMVMHRSGFAYCLAHKLWPNQVILDILYAEEMLCFDGFGLQSLPSEIGLFDQATELSFNHNPLTEVPEAISKLTRLKYIAFNNTPLSKQAIQNLEKWVPLAMANHYIDIAYTTEDSQDYKQAFEYAQKAHQLDPVNIQYLKHMAEYSILAGFVQEGIQYLDQVLAHTPQDLSLYIHFAELLSDVKQYQYIYEIAHRGLHQVQRTSSSTQITHLHIYKGYAMHYQQNYQAAQNAYDQALQLSPHSEAAWFNKACSYAQTNDKTAMLHCLGKAIELLAKNRELAIREKDFKTYWEDEDFLALVGRAE